MPKRKELANHTVMARKALDCLWQVAHLKGRCWGPRRPGNRYAATNITIAIGNELISVSWNEKLIVHEFCRTKNTALGKKAKRILRAHGLPL